MSRAFALALLVATTTVAQPRTPTHVLCIGDSTTFGVPQAWDPTTPYPAQLSVLFDGGVSVFNAGHSGATLMNSPNVDYPWVAQPEHQQALNFVNAAPDGSVIDVVIVLGANDSKQADWPHSGDGGIYMRDYTALVQEFASLPQSPTVFLGFPLAVVGSGCCDIHQSVIHDAQIPIIRLVAADAGMPWIDLNTPTIGHTEWYDDGVHMLPVGYGVMAQLVRAGLLRVPQVILSAPTSGTVGTALMLHGQVDAGTVPVTRAEFFEGSTSLGLAGPPFDFPFTPTQSRTHAFTLEVTDRTGARARSATVYVAVSGTPDAGAVDAGRPDAGTQVDAGPRDAGTPDAGTPDAGTPDAGPPDAGSPDAGTPDAGPPDAGVAGDAGPETGASFDSGVPTLADAGTVPSGVIGGCGCRSGDASQLLLALVTALIYSRKRAST